MNKESPVFRTMIGGQAIIEGIMMRGPDKAAIVVRGPDRIEHKTIELKALKDKYPILGWPVIRGVFGFFDAMKLGVTSLMFSADFFPEDESAKPSKFDEWINKRMSEEKAKKIAFGISVTLGLAMPVVIFFLLPAIIASLFDGVIGSGIFRNLLESALKLTLFFGFIILVSKMKDIQRVFAYHGAEHKTIHCYEAGKELTVENVQSFPRQHPRCGTSFLLIVILVSILAFSLVTWSNPVARVALRIALLPLVVGVSFEINRYAGRHDNWFTRILRAPGIWLQNFTTREPDNSMVEVGIESLKMVVPETKGKDEW